MTCGEEARRGVSLSTISGAIEFPEDNDCWGDLEPDYNMKLKGVKITIVKTGHVYGILGHL